MFDSSDIFIVVLNMCVNKMLSYIIAFELRGFIISAILISVLVGENVSNEYHIPWEMINYLRILYFSFSSVLLVFVSDIQVLYPLNHLRGHCSTAKFRIFELLLCFIGGKML